MKSLQKPKAVNETPLTLFGKSSLAIGVALLSFSGSNLAQAKPGNGHISDDDWTKLKKAPRQHKYVTGKQEVQKDNVLSVEEGIIPLGAELTVNGSLFIDDSFIGGNGHLRVQRGGRLILSKGALVGVKTTIEKGGVLIVADPQPATLPKEPPVSYRYSNVECYGEIKGAGKIESDVVLRDGGSIVLDATETPPGEIQIEWVSSPSPSLITITGSLNSSSGKVTETIQVTGTNTSTHGQLAVYGTVAINGAALTVKTINGSSTKPTAGAVFDFIKATDVTGSGFATPTFDPTSITYSLGAAGGPPGSPSCPPYDCYFLTRN